LLNPQFIYFDLDDTLLDHRKAEKCALRDVKGHFAEHFDSVRANHLENVYHEGNVDLWERYAHGTIKKEQLRIRRFEILLEALAIELLDPHEVSDYYLSRYGEYWTYCGGARDVFFAIAERYPVGILTNGFAEIQHAKLEKFQEVRDILKALVISEEVGYMKPHPRLFAHAAEQAGASSDSILYVGDSYRSDVEGGSRAGWQVIWYAPEVEIPPAGVMHAKNWHDIAAHLL
jgi:YjjG family noncanonical pyrimidine nucleotidase